MVQLFHTTFRVQLKPSGQGGWCHNLLQAARSVVHAHALMTRHRSFAVFSSIPVEYRHGDFKLDMRHAFLGYRLASGSAVLTAGLGRVVANAGLDLALRLRRMRQRHGMRRVRLHSEVEAENSSSDVG